MRGPVDLRQAKQSVFRVWWMAQAADRFLANERSAPETPRGGEYFTRIYVAFHAANAAVV